MSINTELTALADAIRAKSGTEGKLSISGMTTAVNNIVINAGDDIDLSGVTVTADKMLSGIVAIGATGEKVTGNIATVTPNLSGRTFTVAKGYVAENFEASVPEATVNKTESKVTISAGYVSTELSYELGGGIDTTTSVPPSAADVRLGKEFWANGEKYTGTMPDALVTVEDNGDGENKLTITAGFLENDFELEYAIPGVMELPFVTAAAADIREGKVGADNEGNPVYGTLVVGGDTPVYTSSAIYRCTELVSHPDDIIVSSGTWIIKGFKENAVEATEVERAFSLVGTYKLVDPSVTGRLRHWICEKTEPCVVDGQQYDSAKIYIYFAYDHGQDSIDTSEIDSWCILVEEADGFRYQLFCQNQAVDSEENSPDEVTNWTVNCRHIDLGIALPDLEYTRHSIEGTPPVMSLRGGDKAVWTGDAIKFSSGEWSSTGEAPVQLTASGYVPIVGKSYTADTGALAILYPDIAGEPEVENEIGVVKVTEFIPYAPAFSGVVAVNVSGISNVGNPDEGWGEDYSEACGLYNVTADTYYEENEKKRIYKHETLNYWLRFYDDTENEWYGSNYWVITSYESDSDPYGAILCYAGDSFPEGFGQWESFEFETSHGINTWRNRAFETEQPLVLNAAPVSEYDNATWEWVFSAATKSFDGYELTPHVGEIFVTNGRKLIGNSLGYDPADMESNAVMYSNPGADEGVAVQGRVLPYMHKTIVKGVPCVWFDIETAGQQGDVGIGSRESFAYIPLSKMITLRRPDVMPVPKPPYNQMSLVGTMFCWEWGNSGHIIGLSKEVNAATSQWGGDNYRGAFLGVNFDPNWGFKVDSALGYPADYKKMYNEFNGKWMQFVLTVSENNVRLYLNGELRVTAYNIDFGGYNPAEFNYLFFRQSDGMGELIHFGKMYAFDRVLGEAEIAYQYKLLQGELAVSVCPTTFTSNTSIDGYVVNQSHGGGTYPEAYVVFNQRYDEPDYAWFTGHITVSEDAPAWFSIELPRAVQPSSIMIMNEIESPMNFKNAVFQGSNDGAQWHDLLHIDDSPDKEGLQQGLAVDTSEKFKHFRMLFTAAHSNGVSVQAFQIYTKENNA